MAEDGDITPKQCYDFMGQTSWLKPDKLDWLSDEEFRYCMSHNLIDKWGK
jgi:hypothetical protein